MYCMYKQMKILFIINPTAGKGTAKKSSKKLKTILQKKSIFFDFKYTNAIGDAKKICKQFKQEYDLIVVFGGDGTINEAVNGLYGSNTPLGVIPNGTGNDFARSANIPLKINDAIDNIINGKKRKIDIGIINGQYFINVVGIGFDGYVNIESKKIKFLKGKPVFVAAVLKTLNKWRAVPVKILLDNNHFTSNSYLICISNGWSVGGGLSMTPNAKIDDGLFDVCHLKEISPFKIVANFPKLTNGRIEEIDEVKLYKTKKIKIESDFSLPIHVDGEIINGKNKSFEIEIIKDSFYIWNSSN